MSTPRPNPLFGSYEAVCVYDGCGKGKLRVEEAASVGYKVGDLMIKSTDPAYGRCPLCRRYFMKIVSVPERATPQGPKGFSKIPST